MATNIPEVPGYTGDIALRSDPENFPQNAEDQYSYLATLSTGLNSTVTAMNTVATEAEQTALSASTSADIAASNANFDGLWSTKTGAKTVPYSVSNNGRNWQLLVDIADITASEPQDGNPDWQELTTGTSDLQAAALSTGITYSDIIYATDLVSPIPGHLFKADEQITYAVPSDALGKVIQSVTGQILTTTDLSEHYLRDTSGNIEVINVADFGVSGTISSLDGFTAIENYITERNIKSVKLVFGERLTLDLTSNYLALDGLDNFIIDGITVEDIHDYESTGNFVFTRMFDLTNVKNVSITNAVAVSTLESVVTDSEKKGFTFVRSIGGDTFHYQGSVAKCYRPFEVWGTSVVSAKSYAKETRYNGVAQKGCGNIDFDLVGEGCRRDFYVYGCTGGNITVDSIDPAGHSPLILVVENDDDEVKMSNLDVKFRVRNSRDFTGSRIAPVTLNFTTLDDAVGEAVARNVNITYDVIGDYGTVINLAKYKASGDGDDVARGYVIDGLSISGYFESTHTETTRLINYDDDINWFAGDFISKVLFDELTVNTVDGYNFSLNLDRVFDALYKDNALTFNSCDMNNGEISATADYGKRVGFTGNNKLLSFNGEYSKGSRKTLSKKDWVISDSAATGVSIQIAQVDNERSTCFINLDVKAHGNPEALNSTWCGSINGYVTYSASGTPSVRIQANKLYENTSGVLLNPTITANSSGEIYLSLPEWTDATIITQAEVWMDFDLNYSQYTNIDNPNIYGLYSNKFNLSF